MSASGSTNGHVKLCTQSRLAEIDQIGAAQRKSACLGELAGALSQRPAVLHADSRHLQSHYRTDRKTDVHFCRTPFNVRPGTGATARARL